MTCAGLSSIRVTLKKLNSQNCMLIQLWTVQSFVWPRSDFHQESGFRFCRYRNPRAGWHWPTTCTSTIHQYHSIWTSVHLSQSVISSGVWESGGIAPSCLASALERDECSASRPRTTPRGLDTVETRKPGTPSIGHRWAEPSRHFLSSPLADWLSSRTPSHCPWLCLLLLCARNGWLTNLPTKTVITKHAAPLAPTPPLT
jgi:hypothetical protein